MTVGDQLYFKVDNETKDAFELAGSRPFVYKSKSGKPVAMAYWETPVGAVDYPEAIRPVGFSGGGGCATIGCRAKTDAQEIASRDLLKVVRRAALTTC